MKNKIRLRKWTNATQIRMNNKSVTFIEDEDKFIVVFRTLDKEPNKPSCKHDTIKNKIRQTTIKLSEEGIDMFIHSYLEMKKLKNKRSVAE
jgi:hypothetical protein